MSGSSRDESPVTGSSGTSATAIDVFATVADQIASRLEADGVVIAAVENEGRTLRSRAAVLHGHRHPEFEIDVAGTVFEPLVGGLTAWATREGRPVESLASETMFPGAPAKLFLVAVPDSHGRTFGVIAVLDPTPENDESANVEAVRSSVARVARRLELAANAESRAASSEVTVREEALQRQIDTLQRVYRELALARDGAEAASRTKTEFLRSISQDLRTSMTGVLGTVSMLLDTSLDAEQRELALSAREDCDAVMSNLDTIADFVSLETADRSGNLVPFDLRATAEEVVDQFAPQTLRAGVELVLQFAGETPRRLVGDPGRVRQVLAGLLDGAVRRTVNGHVLLKVDAPVVSEADVLACVTVEDTGTAFTPDQLARALNGLEADDAGAAPVEHGALALAAIKRITEQLGGTMLATSRPGEGTRVSATLKLARDTGTAVATEPGPAVSSLVNIRVLVVDDVEIQRMVLRRQMTGLGMRVEVAPDGATALAILRTAADSSDPFRVALIDQVMPGMSGEQLGRALRADARTADLALMMVTAAADRSEARRFQQAGFDGFFVKPVLPSTLHEALVAVLAARSGARSGRIVTRQALDDVATAPAVAADPNAPPRVLVAEDNSINRRVAKRMLEYMGFVVDVAVDGREAVERWRSSSYSLVFMDCDMPEMDGFEASRTIREAEAATGTHTPIIALTASVLPGDREKCRASGMDDFLGKPLRDGVARMIIRRTLEKLGKEPHVGAA